MLFSSILLLLKMFVILEISAWFVDSTCMRSSIVVELPWVQSAKSNFCFNCSDALFIISGRIRDNSHFLWIFPPLVSVSCLLTQQPSSPQMDFFTQTLSHARGAALADCKNSARNPHSPIVDIFWGLSFPGSHSQTQSGSQTPRIIMRVKSPSLSTKPSMSGQNRGNCW